MALDDTYRAIKELREFSGDPEARLRGVLGPRGWLKYLDNIPDADARALYRIALENLADVGHRTTRAQNTKDKLERRAKAKAATDAPPDMFDDLVGRSPEWLVSKLRHDTYFVASLGREVTREELLSELGALAELHAATRDLRREAEAIQKEYVHDEAIFAELLRQLGGVMAA